jgi:hypothetical protein
MFFECKRNFAKKISIDQINIDNKNNITILQLKRWQHIIEDRLEIGTSLGLDPAFLLSMPELIHEASIQRQTQIFNTNKP